MKIHEDVPVHLHEKIRQALECPSDFGPPDIEGLFETWSIGPVILTRDSETRERANCEAILIRLEEHPEWEDDWQITRCSHWAVGWVEHLTFRVLDDEGRVSDIFMWLLEIYRALEEYPILDEDIFSRLEYESRLKWIEVESEGHLREDLPDDWQKQVYGWIYKNDPDSLEGSREYIPQEATLRACEVLGYLEEEEEDDE